MSDVRSVTSLFESPIEKKLGKRLIFISIPECGYMNFAGNDALPEPSNTSHYQIIMSAQAPVGPYRADFLFSVFCNEIRQRVAVECDGSYHKRPEQKIKDARRDAYFLRWGIKTLRFTGTQITHKSLWCTEEVQTELRAAAERARQISYDDMVSRVVA